MHDSKSVIQVLNKSACYPDLAHIFYLQEKPWGVVSQKPANSIDDLIKVKCLQ